MDHAIVDTPRSSGSSPRNSPEIFDKFAHFRQGVVYLFLVLIDRNSPSLMQQGTAEQDQRLGFVLEVDEASTPLPCQLVRGFEEALEAAKDPRISMPSRLVIISPDIATSAWFASWSEDEGQVRRRLRIRRGVDGTVLIAVVTLAAFGHAIPTALSIESLRLPSQKRRIVRSGVHPKSFSSAILAHYARFQDQSAIDDGDDGDDGEDSDSDPSTEDDV